MTNLTYYRDDQEFFINSDQILFYETSDSYTYAHTRHHIYRVKCRLYELASILPPNFLRISKSAIININPVLSFATTVGTTGTARFAGTHKRIHVSRQYIKPLRSALRARSQNHVKQTTQIPPQNPTQN